jgi:hypothetical protein
VETPLLFPLDLLRGALRARIEEEEILSSSSTTIQRIEQADGCFLSPRLFCFLFLLYEHTADM